VGGLIDPADRRSGGAGGSQPQINCRCHQLPR
jgi:hypothetical protein